MVLFVLSLYPFDMCVGVWAFVTGLSQISSLFLSIMRITYNFLNMCPFDYTAVPVSGKVVRSKTGFTTHTSGVAVVTPTDRPKSVRNRCLIKVLGSVFVSE